jgi:hypothetical protein
MAVSAATRQRQQEGEVPHEEMSWRASEADEVGSYGAALATAIGA